LSNLSNDDSGKGTGRPTCASTPATCRSRNGQRASLANLDQQRKTLAPTFAFVDPFGFSEAPLDLLCRLLAFDTCEVLFTFMFDHVNRFITEEKVSDHLNNLFGTDEYRQAAGLTGDQRKMFLHDLYQRQLQTRCGSPT
jgi:three-Cys-motif partner protein